MRYITTTTKTMCLLSHWDLTGHVQQEAKGRKRDGGVKTFVVRERNISIPIRKEHKHYVLFK